MNKHNPTDAQLDPAFITCQVLSAALAVNILAAAACCCWCRWAWVAWGTWRSSSAWHLAARCTSSAGGSTCMYELGYYFTCSFEYKTSRLPYKLLPVPGHQVSPSRWEHVQRGLMAFGITVPACRLVSAAFAASSSQPSDCNCDVRHQQVG
jgi:hypothetical protein